jgi:two-component system heavy metal sensor histidine kinase CusS
MAARALMALSSGALLVALAAALGAYRKRTQRIALIGGLQSACVAQQAFSATVAHELRAPLTNLILNTEITIGRARDACELRAALVANLQELQVLQCIVEDMLFLAASGRDARRLPVNKCVAGEVQGGLEDLAVEFRKGGMAARLEGDLQARALLDPALFRRALSNLLRNAITHSRAGDSIAVHVAREDSFVWIRVRNTGGTIPGEHLSRIFEPFYRVEAAHGPFTPSGYGLGLSIVKAIAGMHGGSVAAVSRDGSTSIAFSVPAASR